MTLINQIESASGPSRELDAEIAREFGFIVCAEPDRAHPRMYGGDIPKQNKRNLPAFTASIDAALMLVPEGTYWLVGYGRTHPDEPLGGAQIILGEQEFICEAATPALSIVLSALKARGEG